MPNVLNYQTINIIQLSIGFFLVLFAFTSQGFIEETVIDSYADRGHINKHVGYISLAIIYAVDTIGNFFAPSIIRVLNLRFALILSVFCYALFQFGFLFLNEIYLLISSALAGFGATIFWTAQGKYLTLNSTKETAGFHSGIFWASAQGCLAFGGVFLYAVFRDSNENADITVTTTRIIYGVFGGVTLIGLVTLGTLRIKLKNANELNEINELEDEDEDRLSPFEMFSK